MTDDLAQLLRSADGGAARPDLADIARRGRRLRVVRAAGVVAAVVVVAGGIGIAYGLAAGPVTRMPIIGEPEPTDATPDERADPQLEPRSQSPEDAARDGVLDEVAALPLDVRLGVERAGTGSGEQRVEVEEGVWAVSRPNLDDLAPDRYLQGDASGRYGRDFIDLVGYGEVLLLNHAETEILRAYPFPDAAPQTLLATDDAIYCARQGDGGLPDSMLCRIDRETLEARVRVFPRTDESHFLDPEAIALPDTWTVDDPHPWNVFGGLEVRGGDLYSVGQQGNAPVDPVTLELLDDASDDLGDPTEDDRQLIEGFLAFAADPGPPSASALPFADEVAIGLGPELHRTLAGNDLADPTAWPIDVEEFRAYVGPFSALEVAADADEVEVSVGEHPHCASPPMPPPPEVEDLRRVSVQPKADNGDSCLQWWTVDLFVTDDGRIAAVTMDLYEP
ncbi:MAG TPA: hypothetical protein VK906_00725 [Egicoccus sp.]|nr:hypothetical protein [Egicoccus sp.]HSK21661.1 hypothetical protein [Egicoccus sp.]